MGRDEIKSASLHSFHASHTEPAETNTPFEHLVREMLERLGENPERDGLKNTPARVEASLKWLTRGYGMDVEDVIGDALFEEKHENMILVRDIEIYSLCEHHLLPFFGRAHVAYLPNGRIVGLSKIPRVIEAFQLCMMMRGVEKQNSKTVTSALRGAFRDDAKTRDEFLRLAHGGGHWPV